MATKSAAEVNKTWPQYLAVSTALFAAFCTGLHFGWPTPSLPKILSSADANDYPFNVTEAQASYITIISSPGLMVGSIVSSLLADAIGRKLTIFTIALPQIASMLLFHFSYLNPIYLYVGRFIGGLAEGACFTVLPIYVGEICEPKIRGQLGSCFSFVIILGMLTVNVAGTYLTIYINALACAVLPLLFIVIGLVTMPETPYYHVIKGRMDEAKRALRKLRRVNNVSTELTRLISDVQRQMSEPGRLRDLWTIHTNRKACTIMIGLRTIQQFSGVSAFNFYAQIFFSNATDQIPAHFAATIMLALQAMCTFCASLVVDRAGRRPLLIASCIGCATVLLIIAGFFIARDYTTAMIDANTNLNLIPMVGMIVFIVAFSVGLGNIVNLMLSELFSASIKARAACIMNIVFSLTLMLSTKFYQYLGDRFGLAVPMAVFGLCQIIGAIFCRCYVPETTGKSLETIQQELKGHKFQWLRRN